MKNFLCEQDDITIECLLGLKNSNFALGLHSGDLNIYKNDPQKKNYVRILKISEHKSGINSLFELPNNSILTASSDTFLKKIHLLNNNTSYKVEYIFTLHTSSVYKGIKLKTKNIVSCGINDHLILWVYNDIKEINNNDDNNNEIYNNDPNRYKTIKFVDAGQGISDIIEVQAGNFVSASDTLQFWTFVSEKSILNSNHKNKTIKNEKSIINKNKVIDDSTESQISNVLHKKNNSSGIFQGGRGGIHESEVYFNVTEKTNNEKNKKKKIYINSKDYYERSGLLDIKASGSNCLCKINSSYLFVILSEEQKGKVALIDTNKIECINIIEISKYELTSISNFHDDSIVISCTEIIDDSFVVFIKQYELSRISGLKFVGQKIKKLSDYYYVKKKENKKEKNEDKNGIFEKINYEYSKRIKEQINCITFTTGGLLICTGKIESPEKKNIVGEIDLFI
jgi:hypothetical protein